MAWPNRNGITKADLKQALNELEQRLTANADDAHAAIGKRLDRIDDRLRKIDNRLHNLEAKLLSPAERVPQ